jgi:hypothetical protein
MSDSESEEFGEKKEYPPLPPSVRLVIVPDPLDGDWTHFYTARGLAVTYNDLPKALSYKLRSVVNSLVQRKISKLDFDSARTHTALADSESTTQHPFDLRLLREDEDFEDLFAAVIWWIEREQRRMRCGTDSFHGTQPHKTWTCECGAVVDVEKVFVEMCSNPECPTWDKYRFCTGQSPKKLQRLA